MRTAHAPERPTMGDKNRFQVRVLNDKWQVYSLGLETWAICPTEDKANAVQQALELFYQCWESDFI